MKTQTRFGLIALLLLFILSSCEEVIDVDLNSTNPVVVAEGYMDLDSLCSIKLSFTTDYFHQEDPEFPEEARVSIADETGALELMVYQGNGIYLGQTIRGRVGGVYTATIETKDQVFSGNSSLMPVPEIDTVAFEDFPFGGSLPPEDLPIMLVISFKRDPGRENNFMLKIRYNGELIGEPFALATDRYSSQTDVVEYNAFLEEHESGDTLSVEFYAIDADLFRYYSQMNEAINGNTGMSTTPYNPASNLGEDILGYFMARSRNDTILFLP